MCLFIHQIRPIPHSMCFCGPLAKSLVQGAQEAHALIAGVPVHNAVYTNKLNAPDLMQHNASLRDHSSWPRQGPWGA